MAPGPDEAPTRPPASSTSRFTIARPIPAPPLARSRDRASGGAGIGLAIVKRLVEEAGGRVGASSEAGVTTFWFSLPT